MSWDPVRLPSHQPSPLAVPYPWDEPTSDQRRPRTRMFDLPAPTTHPTQTPVRFQGTWTVDVPTDAQDYLRITTARRPFDLAAIIGTSAFLGLLVLLVAPTIRSLAQAPLAGDLLALGTMLTGFATSIGILLTLWRRRSPRRAEHLLMGLGTHVVVELREGGVTVFQDLAVDTVAWRAFAHWTRSGELVVLQTWDEATVVFSLAAFTPEEHDDVMTFLSSRVAYIPV